MNMEKTHKHTVSRVAGALVASAALMPVASHAQELSLRDIAQAEIQRREAQVAGIDNQIKEAREAYLNKDFQKSVNLYTGALAVLPQGRVVDDRREFLTESLAQASVELSKTQVRQGDVVGARETLGAVIKMDPTNTKAIQALDQAYDPIRTNPATTKEHGADVRKVSLHLYKGEGFYNAGLYNEAHTEFDKALRVDPYNMAARRWQTKVNNTRSDYYRAAYDETRSRLLSEVDKAWEIVPTPVAPQQTSGGVNDTPITDLGVLVNQRKLQSIIIPRLDIEDSTLDAAIAQLSLLARDNDPETDINKKGVSFVVRRPRISVGVEGGEDQEIRINSLELQNVPLGEALNQICLQCEPRMRVKVEEYVIAIVPAVDFDGSETFNRNFNVPPDFIERLGGGGGGGASAESSDIFGSDDSEESSSGGVSSLKETFESMGVKFPGSSNVRFIPATSTLAVTNTAIGLDQIDKIIADVIIDVPKQISITAKFVEISQQDTDELGFDWIISPFGLTANSLFLGGGNVGNGTPRTAANFGSVPGAGVSGIPGTGNVFNTPTAGLRSGDTAITSDSIDSFLNNPTRTAQNANVAPGILSVTGLFTDGQVQVIMRGLAQKRGTDVMNAPTILARPGESARIEVVRQFIYPTEYDPPEIPDNIGGGNNNNAAAGGIGAGGVQVIPITPATPTAFEERPTGVILEILPKVGEGADKRTISLDLEPEIVEFEGFINYGSPIQAVAQDAFGNPIQVTVTENRIEMPVFSRRSIRTGLTIFDGHTVAVGGLISEQVQKVEDKVPVLGDLPIIGRLFQSNAESRLKSNLVIFVTANIIDATGRKLYGDAAQVESSAALDVNSSSSLVLPPL